MYFMVMEMIDGFEPLLPLFQNLPIILDTSMLAHILNYVTACGVGYILAVLP